MATESIQDIENAVFNSTASSKKSLLIVQIDSTTFLPVKGVSDGGSPALAKLVITIV